MRHDFHSTAVTWMCDLCGPLWHRTVNVPFHTDTHQTALTKGIGGEYERRQYLEEAEKGTGGRKLLIPGGPVLFLCPACYEALATRVGPLKDDADDVRHSD